MIAIITNTCFGNSTVSWSCQEFDPEEFFTGIAGSTRYHVPYSTGTLKSTGIYVLYLYVPLFIILYSR